MREGAKYHYLTFVSYITGMVDIYLYIFSNALKQYITATTKYILDQMISVTVQPVIQWNHSGNSKC